MTSPRIVSIGECMLELARGPDGSVRLGFGGDTLNTALYLARLGADVRYATALGHDPWSDEMAGAWADEGIGLELVVRDPDRVAGLYAIRTDDHGERTFTYWREASAARRLFQLKDSDRVLAGMAAADVLYLSGITLSLFDLDDRRTLTAMAASVRRRGGCVVFDPNYRPRNWSSPEAARAAIADIAPWVTTALPTFDDEVLLYGDDHPDQTRRRWRAFGATEIIVKRGADGAVLDRQGQAIEVATTPTTPVDTTGAGDSFNAAYLSARLAGQDAAASVRAGHALARRVIQHRGAIIPRDLWRRDDDSRAGPSEPGSTT